MLVEKDLQIGEVLSGASKVSKINIPGSVLEVSKGSNGLPHPALNADQHHNRNERLLSMRKIKSRNAARSRRGKENFEFYELAKLLPISIDTSSQLDKASIIRLTMSFLKMREFGFCNAQSWNMASVVPPPNRTIKDAKKSVKSALREAEVSKLFENQLGSRILQSLDGFMFVLNCHGRILYISETVSIYLGLSQVEMIGSSIFDYTYPEDRNELAVNLGLTLTTQSDTLRSEKGKIKAAENFKQGAGSFFVRMKSTLTKRGVSPKSSCYKVVNLSTRAQRNTIKHYIGTRRKQDEATTLKNPKETLLGVIAFGSCLSLQNQWDLPIDQNVFVVRVDPTLQFTYCDSNVSKLLGFDIREITGHKFYHCLHAKDAEKMKKCHIELLTKGNVRTPYYRWLHKSGGYRWVYSIISMMANQRLYPVQTYISVNHVISGVCEPDIVLDVLQLSPEECERQRKLTKRCHSEESNNVVKRKSPRVEKDSMMKSRSDSDEDTIVHEKININVVTDNLTEKKNEDQALDLKLNNKPDKSDENNNTVIHDGSISTIKQGEEKCKSDEAETTDKSCNIENTNTCVRPKSNISNLKKAAPNNSVSVLQPEKPSVLNNTAVECNINIVCGKSDISKVKQAEDSKIQTSGGTESVSEYMDADSTLWENPPNREISNHDDLPPGIKQMHGLWAIRHTPSAVHHHYPFGINPALLHSNPLLAKMMAGWSGCHQLPHANSFVLTTPVHLLTDCDEISNRHFNNVSQDSNTPDSVAAVLEELKKDPLHKVSPPNKVVRQKLPEGEIKKTLSGKKCFNRVQQTTSKPSKTKFMNVWEKSESPLALNLYAGDVARAQAVIQMPGTLLLPSNSMLLDRSDTSIIGLDSNPSVRLPLPTAHFQQHVSSCVLQPFSLPQIAKVRTVPF